MASTDPYKQINQRLITVLKNLLAAGNWDASLFLKAAQKEVQGLLDQAEALSKEMANSPSSTEEDSLQDLQAQGYIKVYVSIYQSNPYNLPNWEKTLRSIKEYSINRPIYREEAYIQEAIRAKGSANEGYVSIYIKESDIIQPYAGKLIEDRWGHELLTLRDTALVPNHIAEFSHLGKKYQFKNGKLLLKSDIS